jgi:asparagine synthase (glutamine-hydrolysing)
MICGSLVRNNQKIMCGIAGILQTDSTPVSRDVLSAMIAALAHRGPDGEGLEVRESVGLGNRRLAIIDLEGGKQPLSNEDGDVWITFNGAIYNYRELRGELESKGHCFRTRSDTETIVHAYEEWGDACVERLRGMFAFAVMDWRRRRLFLARDQLGIKPLYYLHDAHCFAFASELQALRQVPSFRPELDLQAIDEYLWLQYIPAPRTAFRHVNKLAAGHRLSITFDGHLTGPEEYWRLDFAPKQDRSEAEWIEALEETVRDSVAAHLVADVPFGVFLSGGVDSSAVVAYVAQILSQPVRTFSIGFDEAEFNELEYAAQAARRWGAEHHVEMVRHDALAILPQLVRHYGEPFGDSSAVPTYYLCQMARRFVPMVLSGDGGDEAFAGYNSYRAWLGWLHYDGVSVPRWLLHRLKQMTRLNFQPRRPTLAAWLEFMYYLNVPERRALWRRDYQPFCPSPLEDFKREFARAGRYSNGNKVQYLDFKSYLPNDILTKVDVASMMHGLEVRTPLVDVRVAEFAATIPESFCLARDSQGQWEGKRLLKQAMQKYYPREFVRRQKMGFSVPLRKWFAADGPLGKEIRERLTSANSPLLELFEPAGISALLAANASAPLWLLLFLDEWLRQNRSARV